MGRRPIGVGWRPTTDVLNSAGFGCTEENESCSGKYPELIYSVGGWLFFSNRIHCTCLHAVVGWMPITDLLQVFGCPHGCHLVTGSTGVGLVIQKKAPDLSKWKWDLLFVIFYLLFVIVIYYLLFVICYL